MTLSILPLAFPALMVFAASYDSLSLRIANTLCLILALAFFPAALSAGVPGTAVLSHVLCALAMLAVGFAIFAMGWAGGGDAKLFAAAALWLGWDQIGQFAAMVAIAGGVLALGLIAWRLLSLRLRVSARRDAGCAGEMPYGVALACGALCVYPHSIWAAGLPV
jgi:prepilin peptidase CpaA